MLTRVPDRDEWFSHADTFPRPDWEAVNSWIETSVATEQLGDAWEEAMRHWLHRLCARLGGAYGTAESQNFHLLCNLPGTARVDTLRLLETSHARISHVLGEIEPSEAQRKHVIIRFAELDDYYAYISHGDPDGAFAGSAGMFISSGGYEHIAYAQSWNTEAERRTLVHELVHALVARLPLPIWLNEALAMAFEADIAGSAHEPLTRELAARHREYWTASTIQDFWLGRAFSDVDGQELSYSLSRVLLHLIHTEICPPEGEFRSFVSCADWTDAGSAAAKEHLDIPLENLVAAFLGPSDWEPRPELWEHNPGDAAAGDG